MRRAAVVLLTVVSTTALISTSLPTDAQTYAPNFPVCLRVYGPVNYFDCGYTSLPQCNASASGRSAQCVVNPYFASTGFDARPSRYGRHRDVYQNWW
jgi:hypothetical protein